ncbi:SOS response-associated peptidase [Streptacidiphilus sp. N1-12]|uniref:SOS response-associated peptidase n=2 Tax=Streptacidiphilus alkalitolerans TaxID=3342712 RepID=A0ABV6V4V1_9ACTN
MCGRYVSTRSPEDLATAFHASLPDPGPDLAPDLVPTPSWNVAPTDRVWGVLERVAKDDAAAVARELRPLRWGLVPSWAKDLSVGARMINARVETVHEKPSFRKAFTSRRCLLPADGYYEWIPVPATKGVKAHKQPYFLTPQGGGGMAMAGLYEFWKDPAVARDQQEWVVSCTIITTEATDAAGRVHPRMPLTIAPEDFADWLNPEHHDVADLRALLAVPAGGEIEVRPVSLAVNNVRNDGPQLLDDAPATS